MPPSLVLLAEQNPAVKALMDHLNAQAKQLAEQTQSLREGTVTSKLAEFNALGDSGKLVMTPAAQELVREMLLHEAWPTALTEKFWELMSMVKTSASFVVELGERAAGARGYSPQPVQDRVTREIEQLMKTDKNLDYATAATRVLSDPKVWDAYREASTSFVE
jgi:hypothetical protein